MAVKQGADQHIRSSLGFSILPKDTLTRRPEESNQRPSDNAGSTREPQPQLFGMKQSIGKKIKMWPAHGTVRNVAVESFHNLSGGEHE